MTMTPREFARDYITHWEGVYSGDADDNGNWTGGAKGRGALVGSQYGVTPAAIASLRKIPVGSVTGATIKSITLDEAATLALNSYYYAPNLDALPWNQATASIFDFGWGAGPAQAIKLLQRLLDAPVVDGVISPNGATAKLYADLCEKQGVAFVAGAWWLRRNMFYDQIIDTNPTNKKYRNGWRNRSAYFTPGGKAGWWGRFS